VSRLRDGSILEEGRGRPQIIMEFYVGAALEMPKPVGTLADGIELGNISFRSSFTAPIDRWEARSMLARALRIMSNQVERGKREKDVDAFMRYLHEEDLCG